RRLRLELLLVIAPRQLALLLADRGEQVVRPPALGDVGDQRHEAAAGQGALVDHEARAVVAAQFQQPAVVIFLDELYVAALHQALDRGAVGRTRRKLRPLRRDARAILRIARYESAFRVPAGDPEGQGGDEAVIS